VLYRRTPPEVREQLLEMDEVQARLVRAEIQKEAAARFRRGVQENRLTAEHVNRSVVRFFETLELRPVLEDDASIFGLEIRAVYDESPLRESGFRVGDVITRINDARLRDPADLPLLVSELERDFELCAVRDGAEICRRISLP
jgi:type II secretory pathway component PulC